MTIEERLKMIDLGDSIFQKFAGKNTAQIKAILFKILPDFLRQYQQANIFKTINIHEHIVISQVRKVYVDDMLSEITLCYFSSIKIDLTGIMYCAEHGTTKYLINFDNNFNAAQLD